MQVVSAVPLIGSVNSRSEKLLRSPLFSTLYLVQTFLPLCLLKPEDARSGFVEGMQDAWCFLCDGSVHHGFSN